MICQQSGAEFSAGQKYFGDDSTAGGHLADLMARRLWIIARQQTAAVRITGRSQINRAVNLGSSFHLCP